MHVCVLSCTDIPPGLVKFQRRESEIWRETSLTMHTIETAPEGLPVLLTVFDNDSKQIYKSSYRVAQKSKPFVLAITG